MKITLLFSICIFIRILLIYISFLSLKTKQIYYIFSIFYACLGIGSIYHYLTKYRKKGAFNQHIWWDYLRPVHGILYLSSSYFIFNKSFKFVYLLFLDIILGILGHIHYHYF